MNDVMDDAMIALKYSLIFVILSSESFLLAFISCLLTSFAACMIMKCSSDLFSILLIPFGIFNLEVRRAVLYKQRNGCDLVLYVADERQ